MAHSLSTCFAAWGLSVRLPNNRVRVWATPYTPVPDSPPSSSLGTRLFAHGGIVWKTAHIRVVLTPRICKPQRFHKRHVNSKALSKLHASSILNALESTCRIWSRCGSYLLIMHPFWGARRTTLVWAVFQTLPPCAKSLVPRLA